MSAQEFLDIGKNLVSVRKHLIIPESKYALAARSEIGCADFIVARSIRMLAAIDFDYQSAFDRAKINEIRTNGKLTPELNVAQPPTSKMTPEKFLCDRLLTAQFAGCFVRGFGRRHRFQVFCSFGKKHKARREPKHRIARKKRAEKGPSA